MTCFTVDEQDRLVFYGNPAGYLEGQTAVVDPMFRGEELEGYLAKLKLSPRWEDGVFDQLSAGQLPSRAQGEPLKRCRVWQLKPNADVEMRFIGYEKMVTQFGQPDREDYQPVYDGQPDTNDLEEIYVRCNTQPLPQGYTGRSMSMSDVVELYDEGDSAFYYCDRVGFQPIAFSRQEQPQMEDMTL